MVMLETVEGTPVYIEVSWNVFKVTFRRWPAAGISIFDHTLEGL